MKYQPFIKYAGGKSSELKILESYFPKNHFKTLIEPFVGSGAVTFWALQNHEVDNAIISDTNIDLINCYNSIKYDYRQVINKLKQLYFQKSGRGDYYHKRNHYNKLHHRLNHEVSPTLCATFLWLNVNGFNGLVRYNSRGDYNVSYNIRHQRLNLNRKCKIIRTDHQALKHVLIYHSDFSKTMKIVNKDTFLFLDPPYIRQHMFKEYGGKRFNDNDSKKLRNICFRLNERCVPWLQTNTATKQIEQLYSGMNKQKIGVRHGVSYVNYNRKNYPELIITDYSEPNLKHPKLAAGINYFQLRYRCLDLEKLAQLREERVQNPKWYQRLLFYFAISYIHLTTVNDISDKLNYVNNNLFARPLNRAVINDIANEYHLDDWEVTDKNIIKNLNISYREQLQMHTLILRKYHRSKLNLKRRIKNKNSPAKRKRRQRNIEIKEIYRKQMHKSEVKIAQKFNISRHTVSNVLNNK